MIAVLALFVLRPSEVLLPAGAMCPSAVADGPSVHISYGDGKDGFYMKVGGPAIKINSEPGSVHAAGERGPKIAASTGSIFTVWQGDYRKGPKVWYARSVDGGRSFESQRDLLDAKTPGLDHITVAASGKRVIVLWLDGRGGEDKNAPVTTTIWYRESLDGGSTFLPSAEIKVRACACCSFAPSYVADGSLNIFYRSGVRNERDIWLATRESGSKDWKNTRITNTKWVLEGCPMDGPRGTAGALVYSIDGKCYLKQGSTEPIELGAGKYPLVTSGRAGTFVAWQDREVLRWRGFPSKSTGAPESGQFSTGPSRGAAVMSATGPLLVH